MNLSGLYLITDRLSCGHRSVPAVVGSALEGGIQLVQYREKEQSSSETYVVARALHDLTRSAGAGLIINDDVDLVLALGADGLHLGQEDLPLPVARRILGEHKIIGVSVRDLQTAVRAEQEGADYIAVGPVFSSPTKQVVPPLGCEVIRQIRKQVHCPLFGIGGIQPDNSCQVIQSGADGVAVISALHRADDIRGAAQEWIQRLSQCSGGSPGSQS